MADSGRVILPEWKPKRLGPNDQSKRKAKQQEDPWKNCGRHPKATVQELDAVIKEMGLGEPSEDVKVALLLHLNTYLFNLVDGVKRSQRMPSASEEKEGLKGLSGNLHRVFDSLGLDHSFDEVHRSLGVVRAMNPTRKRCLVDASGYEGWMAVDHIARLVYAVAELGVITERALGRPADGAAARPASAQQILSRCMSQLYSDAFGHPPTRAAGSAWLKFLRWGLTKAGFKTFTDDALRKLPIVRPTELRRLVPAALG